ncbi:flagellar hook-basal body complex protein FliE [Fluoribacter dumoffii]|nr:flagellar hook-basal body complex protein FliE [Fluoribacter dumoffii]MCW8385371.1 flagellar hook-basal body complex protein FliE [Fluoribacter dumoffii]MCW8418424.1 flagellar hook-basal body complex protein FliE [Fluoribacter dumoffii]MCW8453734.1 flagellar hook-basal body complex protein FliE [Fluoribacter dumoffii]MCW8462195.1 flagellar hook-basal body complex protein FliE [Fluoribacter dumoffii]MCW8482407.1 flagellar hook-basal body complex protein FliE [Fluoribacter dumoffii]
MTKPARGFSPGTTKVEGMYNSHYEVNKDMNDINTVNLLNQIKTMSAKAESGILETETSQSSFGTVFQQALNQVNDLNQNADALKTRYEMGDPDISLGEVMIAAQKSNLGLEATVRVRNKVVQAYQDIMNMPV